MRRAGIYETLFSYDENMNLQPELATGYKQLNDTGWEIQLRRNVSFHDGTKMDADAVIYSINRVLDPPSNSRSSEYSFIKNIYKTDDYTIVVETNESYAPAIPMFTDTIMSIVSPEASDLDKEPVGTGPFMFVSFEPGASIELVKNPDYWGGEEPKIDRVIIQYSKDATARTLLLKSGDVDITREVLQSEYASLEADPDINIVSRETLRTYFMYVNEGKAPPFDDVKVRQALNYALDRQEIVDTALEALPVLQQLEYSRISCHGVQTTGLKLTNITLKKLLNSFLKLESHRGMMAGSIIIGSRSQLKSRPIQNRQHTSRWQK